MELTVVLCISIISCVISVSGFVLNRKDKSNNEVKEEQKEFSKHDLIEYRLQKIEQNIEKILNKLDTFDKEMKKEINLAIENHVAIYHKESK